MERAQQLLPAIKSTIWLFTIAVAYAWAAFISPEETITSSGLAGYSKVSLPLFNWQLFINVAAAVVWVIPVVSLLKRQILTAVFEFILISAMIFLAWKLAQNLGTEQELKGLQGWKEKITSFLGQEKEMQKGFLVAPFLLVFISAFSIWALTLRLVNSVRNKNLFSNNGILQLLLMLVAVASLILFVTGIHQPVFHSKQFWIMEEDVSLSASVYVFWRADENFIAGLILIFTFVFPLIKFSSLFWALLAPDTKVGSKVNDVLSWLGKWSMLDVFVVALLLVNMKLDSALLNMELRNGIVYFSVSILLTMLCSAVISWMGKGKAKSSDSSTQQESIT